MVMYSFSSYSYPWSTQAVAQSEFLAETQKHQQEFT